MTIKEIIEIYVSNGFTIAQAKSFTAQQIILSKIEKSRYVDKVLLKGGVVMYNITQEKRRSTLDLDFDFIRFDIKDNENIKRFLFSLNKILPQYKVALKGSIEDLHQQDYKGKRVVLTISDSSESIKFKMDIGVHTLLDVIQKSMCFTFENSKPLTLLVNPPEQIFAEKLFSLAKVGPTSRRFRDIDDMYYLIKNVNLDKDTITRCLISITSKKPYGLGNMNDVIAGSTKCLESEFFENSYLLNGGSWFQLDYQEAKNVIISFINSL